jgi:protein-S-isoprenylcysteine O-methyltransferase Ste14
VPPPPPEAPEGAPPPGPGQDHGPGVRLPPPVMAAAAVVAAWVLQRLMPAPLGPPAPGLGGVVILLALGLIGWALLVLARAGNDPRPDRPDAVLVEAGPFRFSRNPVYLGFVLCAAGFALRWGTLWAWLATAGLLFALDRLVVAWEESYLAARFGAAYEGYRRRVRRWV